MRGTGILVVALLAACSGTPPADAPAGTTVPEASGAAAKPDAPPAFVEALDRWHASRVEGLKAEDGWLALVGLAWLDQDGEAEAGSGAGAAVRLPRGAASVGTFTKDGTTVRFTPREGVVVSADGPPMSGPLELRNDQHEDGPTVLDHEGVIFHVIERQGRIGVRIKDPQAPTRTGFTGVPRFDADPAWVITARLERHPEPVTVSVPTVLGTALEEPSPGVLVFEVDGIEQRLTPLGDESGLFLVFGDATNGLETYGGGRFLSAPGPGEDGTVELDFNKAINPPCAFTDFATCPLPPKENKLRVAIEAGEKVPPGAPGH